MRRTRSLLSLPLVALLATACAGGPAPGWTYAPPSESAAASGSPGASASASPSASASAPAPASPSASPTASASPSAPASPSSPAASAPAGAGLTVVARNFTFELKELTTAADQPFQITLDNQDAGVPHDIDIRQGGTTVEGGDTQFFNGVAMQTFDYPALAAGTYEFICSVHPTPAMTGTLTVE